MFNLFRKKSKKPVPPPEPAPPPEPIAEPALGPSAKATAAIDAWRASSAEIRAQFESVLVEAIHQSKPFVDAMQTDLSPVEQVWSPIERELHKAQDALDRAWQRPHAILYKDPSLDEEEVALHDHKLDQERNELELAFQAAYRQIKAQAAQAMMQFALHRDARSRHCGACGGGLASVLVGLAQDIECPGCHTTQRVEPGQAFRVFAAAGAYWVGEWDAFGHYQAMRRAKVSIERYRSTKDVPMELLHSFHDAAHKYWHTALSVEAHLVPHLSSHVSTKLEARMKEARRLLRNHWQWRAYEQEA